MILNVEAEKAMREHAERGYPGEVCGLLIGSFEDGRRVRRASSALPAVNLNQDRPEDRYEMNPADYLHIEKEARSLELEVVGVYHSHPDHPSRPSETDRLRAEEIWDSAESWSYVILGVASGLLASRSSWVLREGAFQEEEIHVVPFRP